MSQPTHPALEALRDIADRSSMLRETKDATLDSVAQQAHAAIPALEELLAERDELLAALKDLESRRILDCLVQPACGDCSCCRAFAAIAKAEGES